MISLRVFGPFLGVAGLAVLAACGTTAGSAPPPSATAARHVAVAITDHGATGGIAWRAAPHDGEIEMSAALAPDGTVVVGTDGTSEWAYHPDGGLAWHTGGRA